MSHVSRLERSVSKSVCIFCTGSFQCVCQVFYHKEGTNWWKIKFAFCPREYLDVSCIPVIMTIVYVAIGTGDESILPDCKHWSMC